MKSLFELLKIPKENEEIKCYDLQVGYKFNRSCEDDFEIRTVVYVADKEFAVKMSGGYYWGRLDSKNVTFLGIRDVTPREMGHGRDKLIALGLL